MELVTGKAASDHISSADMASFYRGLLIADDAVLDTGDKLSCTMTDANTAEIGTGDCMIQAHHARVEVAEQLTVRSGSQGFNRNDLVVVRYTLGTGNIQSVYLAIVEGTAVAGEAEDPDYETGDIDGGSTLVEFPLWRIPITGVNVGTPERIMPTVDTLQSQISTLRDSVVCGTKHIGMGINSGAIYSFEIEFPSEYDHAPKGVFLNVSNYYLSVTVGSIDTDKAQLVAYNPSSSKRTLNEVTWLAIL